MPQRVVPPRLFNLSINAVFRHLDHIYGNDLYEFQDFPQRLHAMNTLPAWSAEKILQYAQQKDTAGWSQLFLTRTMTRVIVGAEGLWNPFLWKAVLVTCQNLTHLELVLYNETVEVDDLVTVAPQFEKLRFLYIKAFQFQDEHINTIAGYLNNLRSFKLHAFDVTDAALINWQVNPRLEEIDILHTSISEHGILNCLDLFPKLRILKHSNTVGALCLRFRGAWIGGDEHLKKYFLRTLSVNGYLLDDEIRPDHLHLATVVCPLADEVLVCGANNVWPDALLPLVDHPYLTKLELINEAIDSDLFVSGNFAENVFPILVKHGITLQHLTLGGICDVDVNAILHSCPNLESLVIKEHVSYAFSLLPPTTHNKLKILKVTGGFNEVSSLGVLLSVPSLQVLEVSNCHELTEDVMAHVISIHKFPKLKRVSFYKCDFVTGALIYMLLQLNNPLKYLTVIKCCNVTTEVQETIVAFVYEQRLLVYLDWYGMSEY